MYEITSTTTPGGLVELSTVGIKTYNQSESRFHKWFHLNDLEGLTLIQNCETLSGTDRRDKDKEYM